MKVFWVYLSTQTCCGWMQQERSEQLFNLSIYIPGVRLSQKRADMAWPQARSASLVSILMSFIPQLFPSPCCSLPTLWLWNSRDPIAHSDLQPATCCPWCSLYLQPSLGPWLYQQICRTFSLFRLLLLFLTGSSQCGSTLVFSDLRLNFLMTALTSCLVLCDTKCLGALETCCANTSAACSRFTGFLVVLHSTEVKLW